MNSKPLIISLVVILFVIIIVGILIVRRPSNGPATLTPTPTMAAPTLIITPTIFFKENVLDIVSIAPADGAVNIGLNTPIEVTFSRSVKAEDIKLYMDPPAERVEKINGKKIVAIPNKQWNQGTTYRFSIYFLNEKEKNRTFTFTTAGPTQQQQTPDDTRDEEAFNEQIQQDREQNPDIYVSNHTPYVAQTFSVTTQFVSKPPAHFAIIVETNEVDIEKSKAEFMIWLKSLELSDNQIARLDIRYQ